MLFGPGVVQVPEKRLGKVILRKIACGGDDIHVVCGKFKVLPVYQSMPTWFLCTIYSKPLAPRNKDIVHLLQDERLVVNVLDNEETNEVPSQRNVDFACCHGCAVKIRAYLVDWGVDVHC